ncbi:hypothetical protein VTK26DRAFT_8086 [Humicola hyalothermophila]
MNRGKRRDEAQDRPSGAFGVFHAIGSLLRSPTTQKALVRTTLVIITAAVLYIPAVLGYLVFYYKYLPDQVTTVPVHLQYGFGPNPFGIAALRPPHHLHTNLPYDISVSLTLPRSPANLDRGNFMIALHLLSPSSSNPAISQQQQHGQLPYITPAALEPASNPKTDNPDLSSPSLISQQLQPTRLDMPAFLAAHQILHTSTRPAIIPYMDPLASLASRLSLLLYHMLFPRTATAVRLTVPMAEQLKLSPPPPSRSRSPKVLEGGSLLLEVQAGQTIQVYEASVTFTARLEGLLWFMYTWRTTAFVLFTTVFWVTEVVVMVVVAVLAWWRLFAAEPEGDAAVVERRGREKEVRREAAGKGEEGAKTKTEVKNRGVGSEGSQLTSKIWGWKWWPWNWDFTDHSDDWLDEGRPSEEKERPWKNVRAEPEPFVSSPFAKREEEESERGERTKMTSATIEASSSTKEAKGKGKEVVVKAEPSPTREEEGKGKEVAAEESRVTQLPTEEEKVVKAEEETEDDGGRLATGLEAGPGTSSEADDEAEETAQSEGPRREESEAGTSSGWQAATGSARQRKRSGSKRRNSH